MCVDYWYGRIRYTCAEGLVRAGIAKLIIVDRDYIEFSNLQRQTLFTEEDALKMMPKVVAAKSIC